MDRLDLDTIGVGSEYWITDEAGLTFQVVTEAKPVKTNISMHDGTKAQRGFRVFVEGQVSYGDSGRTQRIVGRPAALTDPRVGDRMYLTPDLVHPDNIDPETGRPNAVGFLGVLTEEIVSIEKVYTFMDYLEPLVRRYFPAERGRRIIESTGAATISSLVAGGKNTICGILETSGFTATPTSHTTRDPKPRDFEAPNSRLKPAYTYAEPMDMEPLIINGEMVEVAMVHGNIYGTSFQALEDVAASGKRPLLEIDIQGVSKLHSVVPEMPSFFLVPQDITTWLGRWAKRDADLDYDEFIGRVSSAMAECQRALEMAKAGRMTIVLNQHAETAAAEIKDIMSGHKTPESDLNLKLLQQFALQLEQTAMTGKLWDTYQRLTLG